MIRLTGNFMAVEQGTIPMIANAQMFSPIKLHHPAMLVQLQPDVFLYRRRIKNKQEDCQHKPYTTCSF